MTFDAEIAQFIADSQAFAAPPDASLVAHRAAYGRMASALSAGRPDVGLYYSDWEIGGGHVDGAAASIAVRSYTPIIDRRPGQVIYYHGGGLVFGDLESHDDVCAEIALALSLKVLSVDYRLAPEHPHPASYVDALAVAEARLPSEPYTIFAGDSSGANLALAVAMTTRRAADDAPPDPRLAGLALIYPQLGGDAFDWPSYAERAEAPLLTTADMTAIRAMRAGDADPAALGRSDWRFSPIAAEDYSDLPPIVAYGLEQDPLRDDTVVLAERVAAAGGQIDARIFDGLPHGCLRARRRSRRAATFFGAVLSAMARLRRD